MAKEEKKEKEIMEAAEEIKEEVTDAAKEVSEKVEAVEEAVEKKAEEAAEKVEAAKEAVEKKAEKAAEKVEAVEKVEAAAEKAAPAALSSTEAKRKKKAERREAKAARKEANKVEEKKRRPNNGLLALLIFGVLIVMFAFVGLYNYFTKPASIEAYLDENGITEMYNDVAVDEYTTMKLRADGNTMKILFKVAEDAPEEALEQYTGDDGKEMLEELGASYLTSVKPLTQGFGGTVKVGVKQGDKTINYVKLSYREAKKVIKEAQEESEEDAEEASDDADEASDEAEDAAEDAAEGE